MVLFVGPGGYSGVPEFLESGFMEKSAFGLNLCEVFGEGGEEATAAVVHL